MQVIRSVGTYHYYGDVMWGFDIPWTVIVQPIMIVYPYKYEIYFCCHQYFIFLIFLSPLLLANVYTLNYLLWYISVDVVFPFYYVLLSMLSESVPDFYFYFYVFVDSSHDINIISFNSWLFLLFNLDKVFVWYYTCI